MNINWLLFYLYICVFFVYFICFSVQHFLVLLSFVGFARTSSFLGTNVRYVRLFLFCFFFCFFNSQNTKKNGKLCRILNTIYLACLFWAWYFKTHLEKILATTRWRWSNYKHAFLFMFSILIIFIIIQDKHTLVLSRYQILPHAYLRFSMMEAKSLTSSLFSESSKNFVRCSWVGANSQVNLDIG